MIVTEIEQVLELSQSWKRSKELKKQEVEVSSTIEKLEQLNADLESVYASYKLVTQKIEDPRSNEIIAILDNALDTLVKSKGDFTNYPNQVQQIKSVVYGISTAKTILFSSWKGYVEQRLSPNLDLLRLVSQLPKIRKNYEKIEKFITNISNFSERLPSSDLELESLEINFEQLSQILEELQDLTDEIRNFLIRVGRNEFTISDLTESIMDWCSKDDRGKAFLIKFSGRA